MGFRLRLALFVVAVLVVVQGLTAVLVYRVARNELIGEGQRQLGVAAGAFVRQLDDIFLSKVQTLASSPYAIQEAISHADLVIGGVLIPGAAAPKLVTRAMLKDIPKGAVLVDVAVDQGGCFETTHATTHSNPTYYEEGVLHYCVANMPGAVPRT